MNEMISAESFITHAVEKYSDTVYRVSLNITRNPQDSFDISQEVFIRLMKNRHKLKDENHLKAWLIRVTVNLSRTFMRKSRRGFVISIDEVRESELIADSNVSLELTSLVMSLPEKYSTVIYLFYYEDMKISEIASALGISQSAVKQRLSRGREKLKFIIEKEDNNG